MNDNSRFEDYRDDRAALHRSRALPRIGCAGCLIAIGVVAIATAADARLPIIIATIAAVAFFAWHIYLQQFCRRKLRCISCGNQMACIDIPCTASDPRDRKLPIAPQDSTAHPDHCLNYFIAGADGCVYLVLDGESDWSMKRLVQRWYACHRCKLRFMGEPFVYLSELQIDSKKQLLQIQQLIVTKPDWRQEALQILAGDA